MECARGEVCGSQWLAKPRGFNQQVREHRIEAELIVVTLHLRLDRAEVRQTQRARQVGTICFHCNAPVRTRTSLSLRVCLAIDRSVCRGSFSPASRDKLSLALHIADITKRRLLFLIISAAVRVNAGQLFLPIFDISRQSAYLLL